MTLHEEDVALYTVVYEFLQKARVKGTWDFTPVGVHVHGGIPLTDRQGRVTPQPVVDLLERWFVIEEDLIGAMAPSPHRAVFMQPPERTFPRLVTKMHKLRREAEAGE